MSEVDKDLSDRYRAVARDEPPPHVDAAILAAAKRAVGAQPQATWTPRAVRRWYVPVSLAAVLVLSVVVTLQVERERPDIAMPDALPLGRKDQAAPAQAAPAPPAATTRQAGAEPAAKPPHEIARKQKLREDAQPAPAFAPDPKPATRPEAKPSSEPDQKETQRQDALRSADTALGASAPAAAEAAGARHEARAMSGAASAPAPASAPVTAKSNLAKRELAPAEWLERIAELRRLQRDQEADEQLAEFKRRYPDYKIPDAMTERIAPRK